MGPGDSNLKPVINLGNSIVGVSILAMPYCFAQCGVVLGFCLVVFNALMTIWSCKMLIRAANMTRSHTYETLALAVLGKVGKLAIEISIIALNIGTCIAYFVIIGDLAPPVIAKLTGVDISPNTLRAILLVLSALFIAFPLGLLRNVDSLSAISILSLLFYFLLTVELVYLSSGNIRSSVWKTNFVWWDSGGLLKCLPITSLAFACHTQMFVIYSSLHDPGVRRMSQITQRALYLILTLYLVVGLFGYITYCKAEIKGDILANFSLDFISQLTRLGFAASVVVSFPLMIFPCRVSINSLFFSQAPNELHVQEPIPQNRFILITAGIVGSTVIIAILIPNIETVLGLTGATTGSLICFIFPGLLFLKVAGSSADFSNRAKLVLAIGFLSMVLSTFVVLQAETTRGEGIDVIQPVPVEVDANKPDIIKLPPVAPQVPEVPGGGEKKKISGEGVNGKIPDEGGGGGRVVDGDKDKEQRKEPPLPQEVVDKPKAVEKEDKSGVVKPAEKPAESIKVDNPGDNVIDIPPDGGDTNKQKPAESIVPDSNKQPAKVVEEKAENVPKEKQKDTGEQKEVHIGGANDKKVVHEDKAKEPSDKKDSPGGEGGEVKKDDHQQLEKHLEKLSNRLDQLEEENKELREKQEVIQRIQIEQGEEHDAGNGAEREQAKVPPAPHQDLAQKEIEKKNIHQEKNIPKDSDSLAAAAKPTVSNVAGALDIDKQEKAILEALEKEEDRAERGINEPQNENEQAIEEHKVELVEQHKAAAAAEGAAEQPVKEGLRAVGGDGEGGHQEEAVGGRAAVVGDTNREEARKHEGVRENRDVEVENKVEMAAVHQVEQDEIGENAGNINVVAPAADDREREREKKSVGGGDAQDSVKYRKRDLKNVNGSILSR